MEHLDSIVSLVEIPFVNQSFGGGDQEILTLPFDSSLRDSRGTAPRASGMGSILGGVPR